ncbi:MAG: AzlD domain-containing protein [Bacteriovoracaceae bacterium]|nr:AzlD domain-containing protein [Bacteriovoracaceae bacterium]
MIDNNYFLIITFLLCVGTLLIRGSFIAFSEKMNLSPRVRELFTYIPAAIFPALFVPATFFHQGIVEAISGKERFLVLIASSILCYFVRKTIVVIGFGMLLLYFVTAQ